MNFVLPEAVRGRLQNTDPDVLYLPFKILEGIIPEYNVGGLVLGRIEADVYKNIVQHADFTALKHIFKICALFTAPNSISQKLAIFSPRC